MTQYKECNPTSKRGQAVSIMIENQEKPMLMVLPLISAKLGIPETSARSYYKYIVEEGYGPGEVTKARKVKDIHAASNKLISRALKNNPEFAKEIMVKVKVPATETKTPDEIERIRAANLAKMKEITAKHRKTKNYLPGQVAVPEGSGVEDFDPQLAKAEVDAILNDQGLNNIVPKFLQEG
jgi:hypothetical protein